MSIKAELGEADISGIAQNALRAGLAHVRGLNQALDEGGFQRVGAMDAEEHVSFQGRTTRSSGDVTACLTPKGNIAAAGKGQSRLYACEDYEILIPERGDAGRAAEMVAAVARALGKKTRPRAGHSAAPILIQTSAPPKANDRQLPAGRWKRYPAAGAQSSTANWPSRSTCYVCLNCRSKNRFARQIGGSSGTD